MAKSTTKQPNIVIQLGPGTTRRKINSEKKQKMGENQKKPVGIATHA
jgi:hypothetical protein